MVYMKYFVITYIVNIFCTKRENACYCWMGNAFLSQLEHLLPLLSSYQQPASNPRDHTYSGPSMESLLKVGGKMKSAEVVYKPNPSPGGANLFIYHLPQVQTSHQPS